MNIYENQISFPDKWLSKISAHWQTHKMKRLFDERSEKGYPQEPLLVASQNKGVIPKAMYGTRTVEAQKDLHLLKRVHVGDFVISLRSFQGGLEYAYYQGIISPAYTILVPYAPILATYFRYLAKCKPFIGLLTLCVTGIREGQNVDYTKLRNHILPLPPRAEQDQIVRFLDWKVSEINKLIGIKKTYILNINDYEKKLINDKVLHGLHNEKKKFSGNKLIGEIPNTWNILCLGRFCSFQNGISESSDFFTSGTPFVGYGDVYRHIELPSHVSGTAKASEKQQKLFSVQKDDIFFTRTSENIEEIGMSAVCSHTIDKAIFSGFLIRCRQKEKYVIADYMKYYLQIPAVRNHFSANVNIVIRASLNQNLLKTLPVVIPTENEQKEIANYLDSKHRSFTKLIDLMLKEINELKELKNTIISDVVTGKIDIRNVAIPAYEHIDDAADAGDGEESAEELAEAEEMEA